MYCIQKFKIPPFLLYLILNVLFLNPVSAAENSKPVLSIEKNGFATNLGKGNYFFYKPIYIKCIWTNSNTDAITIFLKDHDEYHGTLEYPLGIGIKVENEDGKVLTKNSISPDEFWSYYYLWSTTFEPIMPGDSITLKPGEKLSRLIPINVILTGLPDLKSGNLDLGEYDIQIVHNGVYSNNLKINIIQNIKSK